MEGMFAHLACLLSSPRISAHLPFLHRVFKPSGGTSLQPPDTAAPSSRLGESGDTAEAVGGLCCVCGSSQSQWWYLGPAGARLRVHAGDAMVHGSAHHVVM